MVLEALSGSIQILGQMLMVFGGLILRIFLSLHKQSVLEILLHKVSVLSVLFQKREGSWKIV
jgi:hypothetical protein